MFYCKVCNKEDRVPHGKECNSVLWKTKDVLENKNLSTNQLLKLVLQELKILNKQVLENRRNRK